MGITARRVMNRGDVVRMVTCTGGGYGNPLEREPESVAGDVKNEYISLEQAREDYGVIVDPETFEVTGFTEKRRQEAGL